MAEQAVDVAVRHLGLRRRCRTRDCLLDGAPRQPWAEFVPATVSRLRSHHGLSEAAARHLVGRYGRRAEDVADYAVRYPALALPVADGEPDLRAELAYQRDHEMAVLPADSLLRRTRLGLFRPELLSPPDK
jgi:glycerol-3-phosphate dehydrogenase